MVGPFRVAGVLVGLLSVGRPLSLVVRCLFLRPFRSGLI